MTQLYGLYFPGETKTAAEPVQLSTLTAGTPKPPAIPRKTLRDPDVRQQVARGIQSEGRSDMAGAAPFLAGITPSRAGLALGGLGLVRGMMSDDEDADPVGDALRWGATGLGAGFLGRKFIADPMLRSRMQEHVQAKGQLPGGKQLAGPANAPVPGENAASLAVGAEAGLGAGGGGRRTTRMPAADPVTPKETPKKTPKKTPADPNTQSRTTRTVRETPAPQAQGTDPAAVAAEALADEIVAKREEVAKRKPTKHMKNQAPKTIGKQVVPADGSIVTASSLYGIYVPGAKTASWGRPERNAPFLPASEAALSAATGGSHVPATTDPRIPSRPPVEPGLRRALYGPTSGEQVADAVRRAPGAVATKAKKILTPQQSGPPILTTGDALSASVAGDSRSALADLRWGPRDRVVMTADGGQRRSITGLDHKKASALGLYLPHGNTKVALGNPIAENPGTYEALKRSIEDSEARKRKRKDNLPMGLPEPSVKARKKTAQMGSAPTPPAPESIPQPTVISPPTAGQDPIQAAAVAPTPSQSVTTPTLSLPR